MVYMSKIIWCYRFKKKKKNVRNLTWFLKLQSDVNFLSFNELTTDTNSLVLLSIVHCIHSTQRFWYAKHTLRFKGSLKYSIINGPEFFEIQNPSLLTSLQDEGNFAIILPRDRNHVKEPKVVSNPSFWMHLQ